MTLFLSHHSPAQEIISATPGLIQVSSRSHAGAVTRGASWTAALLRRFRIARCGPNSPPPKRRSSAAVQKLAPTQIGPEFAERFVLEPGQAPFLDGSGARPKRIDFQREIVSVSLRRATTISQSS